MDSAPGGSILVAYTTNAGSTAEVAEAIGERLRQGGRCVDVQRLETVERLDGYGAVVVGAPMILGWSRAAVRFVRRHRAVLAGLRVAYFATAMKLTQAGDRHPLAASVFADPSLLSPPRNPARLSFKENYATAANYLKPIIAAAPDVRPVSVGLFGGKLELFRLKWWQALFVMAIIQVQPGDLRNWEMIYAWADCLREKL